MQRESEPVPVYQLKVTLEGIKPPIQRRIQVSGDQSLFKLHNIIQAAMGWNDFHLHQFIIGEDYFATPSPDDPGPMETKNEKRTKLFQVAPCGDEAKFIYEYDKRGQLVSGRISGEDITSEGEGTEASRLAWAGVDFDPESFDKDEINRFLSKIKQV